MVTIIPHLLHNQKTLSDVDVNVGGLTLQEAAPIWIEMLKGIFPEDVCTDVH